MTDELIKIILTVLVSKMNKLKKMTIYSVIDTILKFYHNPDLETNFSERIIFLNTLLEGLAKDDPIDKVLTSLLSIEKYQLFSILIKDIKDHPSSESDLDSMMTEIVKHNQYLTLKDNTEKMRTFLNNYDFQKYNSVENLVDDYNGTVKTLFMDSIINSQNENSGNVLEPANDDNEDYLDSVMNDYIKFFDTSGLLPSGYSLLDSTLGGGFEKTRLYSLAARPGDGKSTLLLNVLYNWGASKYAEEHNGFFLYVTLENLTFETGMRLFCIDQGMNNIEIRKMLNNDQGKKIFRDVYKKVHKNIYITYLPAFKTTMLDIIKYIETIQSKTGKKILGLITDYIDLFKADRGSDMYRIELGNITMEHKMVAARYKIPVLSCTQLKKDSYGKQATMGDLTESSKKVEHSDAIMLIKSDKINNEMLVDIVKSRNSKTSSFSLGYNPSTFKISNLMSNTPPDHKEKVELAWAMNKQTNDSVTFTDKVTHESFRL